MNADPDQIRGELLEAMAALHVARTALAAGNIGVALVQLDKAVVIAGEVRKQISTQPKSQ